MKVKLEKNETVRQQLQESVVRWKKCSQSRDEMPTPYINFTGMKE